jgi:predicted GIY-YIG superfamily endonuclease
VITYLYRCFNREGELLYVGITEDVERRKREHAKDKFWWRDVTRVTKVAFPRRVEALWAEWAVITTCKPAYNRAVSPPDQAPEAAVTAVVAESTRHRAPVRRRRPAPRRTGDQRRAAVVDYLRSNPGASSRKIAAALRISQTSVLRDLRSLRGADPHLMHEEQP